MELVDKAFVHDKESPGVRVQNSIVHGETGMSWSLETEVENLGPWYGM